MRKKKSSTSTVTNIHRPLPSAPTSLTHECDFSTIFNNFPYEIFSHRIYKLTNLATFLDKPHGSVTFTFSHFEDLVSQFEAVACAVCVISHGAAFSTHSRYSLKSNAKLGSLSTWISHTWWKLLLITEPPLLTRCALNIACDISCSPSPNVFKLFWKEEEMLHHGKHVPVPNILRPAAGIKFEMRSFCA